MGRVKDLLIARREERAQLVDADDLLRDPNMPWDWVLDSMPTCAQPGALVTGLPARTDFRGTDEGDNRE